MLVDMSDMDWLTEGMVEDVEQDVIGTSGIRKLAGAFSNKGDCGDKGAFDNWFSMACWLSNMVSLTSGRSGCSMTGG